MSRTGACDPGNCQARLLTDPAEAAERAWQLAQRVDTLCVHGDTEGAAEIVKAIRRSLEGRGMRIPGVHTSVNAARSRACPKTAGRIE